MPKYYCDYCDTYLTHDSPSVRKTHCIGRKHKDNVRDFYQKWMEEQAQKLIDQTTAAFKSGKILPNMPPYGPRGPGFGVPPPMMPPGILPPVGMIPPPMMMPPGMMNPGMFRMMPPPPGIMPPSLMTPPPPFGSIPPPPPPS